MASRQRYIFSLKRADTEGPDDLMGALERLPGGFAIVSGRGMRRMTVDMFPQDVDLLRKLVPAASIRDYEAMSLIGEGRDGMVATFVIMDGEPVIVLPEAATEAVGLAEADEVSFTVEDGKLIITKRPT